MKGQTRHDIIITANINNDVMNKKRRRATGPNAVGARRRAEAKSYEA